MWALFEFSNSVVGLPITGTGCDRGGDRQARAVIAVGAHYGVS